MHVINWQWRYLSINLPPVDGQLSNDNNGDARAGDPGAGITRTDYLLNLSASPYSVALPCACAAVAPWSEHLFSRSTFRARVNLCVYGVHLVSCLAPVTRYLRYTFLVESRYSFIHPDSFFLKRFPSLLFSFQPFHLCIVYDMYLNTLIKGLNFIKCNSHLVFSINFKFNFK